jgi:leader peptidase (prepilin peptidase) / N-methyltransferase
MAQATLAPALAAAVSPTAARVAVAGAAGLFGLLIGSFLNVVIYRVPRGLSIVSPGSFCPSCGTPVRPSDNIPVASWLVLRGRCRSCHTPISARYPLVEGLTAAVFALVGAIVGPHLGVLALCVLAGTFVALVGIALDHQLSPPAVSVVGAALGLGLFVVTSAVATSWQAWSWSAAAGAAALAMGALVWWGARSGPGEPRGPTTGAVMTLVPLAVLLGWLGSSCPGAAAAGAAVAVVGGLGAGLVMAAPEGTEDRHPVLGLPIGSAAGAVVAFAVAAGLGAFSGG